MSSTFALWLLLLGPADPISADPEPASPPSRMERWFDGAAKQTDGALEAWEEEDFESARDRLDQALEIEPDDARARYNAGTGRLATEDLEAGLPLLEEQARGDGDLAADAAFNLGNAHLGRGDLESAIEAYEQALRRNPDHGDAKHNLELALRQQQEQQEQEQQQQPEEQPQEEESEEDSEEESDHSSGQGPQDAPRPEDSDERPESDDPGHGEESRDPSSGEDSSSPSEPGHEQPTELPPSRLPQFENQDDMTAEQAAALLEAVQNLEREQRLQMAEEERSERAVNLSVEKDW